MASNPQEETRIPNCDIAWLWHSLEMPDGEEEKVKAQAKLMEHIKEDYMIELYLKAASKFGWSVDQSLVQSMESERKQIIDSMEEKLKDAKENFGDEEVRDALLSKANFYCRIGDVANAIKGYEITYEKTVGIGGRLDITLILVLVGFTYADKPLLKKSITKAKEEMEKGGDWERRNRLKVCEGLQCILERKLDEASDLLLSVLPSFSYSPLLSFEQYIFYTGILALICCSRDILTEKVVSAPAVLEFGDSDLKNILSSFCKGLYFDFMQALVPVANRIKRDLYLSRHYLYIIRCLRLRAYKQFLEPYKSVGIENMASVFGVSPGFMEEEVSSFIASGKLTCRIDRVRQVIEGDLTDSRSELYLQTIKEGDVLMNRLQKLARVVAI